MESTQGACVWIKNNHIKKTWPYLTKTKGRLQEMGALRADPNSGMQP